MLDFFRNLLYDWGSRLGIVLVRRRVKKRPQEAETWLALAKLHCVRGQRNEALEVVKRGLKVLPKSRLLAESLSALQAGRDLVKRP